MKESNVKVHEDSERGIVTYVDAKTGKKKIYNENNGTTYYVDSAKKTVACVLNTEYGKFVGKSNCSPEDKFSEEKGKNIARCRATIPLKVAVINDYFDSYQQASEYAKYCAHICISAQERINDLRRELSTLTQTPYDDENDDYELNRIRYKSGDMDDEEVETYETLIGKRVKENEKSSKCEHHLEEEKTPQEVKYHRDANGRFAKKVENPQKEKARVVFEEY